MTTHDQGQPRDPPSPVAARLIRSGSFLLLFLVLYAGAIGALTRLEVRDATLMDRLLPRQIRPGGYGRTLEKLRGIEEVGPVDVVFAGSSHSYRGFDPRVFAEVGLTSFNLGTNSQTPLNSYFLLREHWKRLRPELVLYEIYPVMLTTNGLESFHDLAVNLPLNRQRWAMALATRDPRAFNTLLAVAWRRTWRPLESETQSEFPPERLVGLGYVQRRDTMRQIRLTHPTDLNVEEEQLEYLSRIVHLARQRGARVVFVSQPVVSPLPRVLRGFRDVKERVANLARSLSVPYLDFQHLTELRWDRHFFDANHLNQAGVRIYNRALLDSLRSRGMGDADR